MTSKLDKSPGPAQRTRTRRFVAVFAAAMVAYVLTLTASLVWGPPSAGTPASIVWMLAPMIPIAATAVLLAKYIATSDEFEIIQSCKALAIAFLVAMLTATTVGFLGFAGVDVPGAGWWIYSIGMFAWLVARIGLDARLHGRGR